MQSAAQATDAILNAEEQATLRCIAGHIIPASSRFDVPGADDPAIFTDLLTSLERDFGAVRQALATVTSLVGGRLTELSAERRLAVLSEFRTQHRAQAAILETVVAQCYYRDDRVMRAIGMEPRPPFPKGFSLQAGDFSLLDPVRARGKTYREPS
jgi:hypothetical protein